MAHSLIRRSFVPPRETRNLRDLTRYRVKLVEEHNRIHNRIHKVLEDACSKLDTVASDILGVSGRRIIRAILAGHEDPGHLAYEVRGTLRGKMPELRLVLNGRVTAHHRFLLHELMDDLEGVEAKIQWIEAEIVQRDRYAFGRTPVQHSRRGHHQHLDADCGTRDRYVGI